VVLRARITIAAVGRAKAGPLRDLYRLYADRLTWSLSLKEVEVRRRLPPAQLMQQEAEALTAALPPSATCIALDSRGKTLSSDGLARLIAKSCEAGENDIAFAIGGAEGLTTEFLARADRVLSFGPMTWPHLLARAMLAEQLYRAQSILGGHPYHRAPAPNKSAARRRPNS